MRGEDFTMHGLGCRECDAPATSCHWHFCSDRPEHRAWDCDRCTAHWVCAECRDEHHGVDEVTR